MATLQLPKVGRCVCYAGLLSTIGLADEKTKENPNDTRRYIEDAVKRAIYSHKVLGDAETAEQQLHLALKMAQETIDNQALTYIYDALANLALETGRLADAEKLFVETTKMLIQSGTPTDDAAVLEISVKLADVYAAQGRNDVAEVGYLYCLDCLRETTTSKDNTSSTDPDAENNSAMLWAMCSDSYGRFLMKAARYAEARSNFDEALNVCRRIHGLTHPQTLVMVNNVAGACAMMGDYVTAAAHLENAVNIVSSEDELSPESDLSAYYRNLGVVYLNMGRVDAAGLACRKALETGKKLKDIDKQREAKECLQEISKQKKTSASVKS